MPLVRIRPINFRDCIGLQHNTAIEKRVRDTMTMAYLNYPNSHVTIHGDGACRQIRKMRKPHQRLVEINVGSFASAIQQLSDTLRFGANASNNDLWVSVSFDDTKFEVAVVRYIHRILGRHYSRLHGAGVDIHCQ